jgi:DNA (cytosine-5)-methyltransferase 1
MQFGSVCSGIEAASVAWAPLGWKAAWLAEIEPFPCAVLAHHYPSVPNLGDMTKIARAILVGEVPAPDLFCGGTPCQAFSVAGLRESLADERGNLTLKFVEIANAIDHVRTGRGEDECIVFWENVPGVLSTKDNAFGCFLGGLAGEDGPLEPPGGKWSNAGAVYGPRRAVAWRTLDAQYFGVAQRRRRVFVVASARKGFDPAQVLFEWDGVRRDTAPSREARQTAPTIPARSTAGGGLGTDFDCDGGVVQVCPTLRAGGNRTGGDRPPGTDVDTADSLIVQRTAGANDIEWPPEQRAADINFVRAGRGDPPIPVAYATKLHNTASNQAGKFYENYTASLDANSPPPAIVFDTTQITSAANRSNPQPGDACHPLAAGAHAPAIAFAIQAGALRTNPLSGPDGIGVQADHAYTLEARAEVQAVVFQERGRTDGRSLEIGGDVAYALTAPNGGGRAQERNVLTPAMQVRRLTPVECERLMGFPDGYTAIPWRGKPADQCPDGPRYKALGNSWAVPNVTWIGRRIQAALLTS